MLCNELFKFSVDSHVCCFPPLVLHGKIKKKCAKSAEIIFRSDLFYNPLKSATVVSVTHHACTKRCLTMSSLRSLFAHIPKYLALTVICLCFSRKVSERSRQRSSEGKQDRGQLHPSGNISEDYFVCISQKGISLGRRHRGLC